MVSTSALFCLATVLATFQKIGQFFPNHLVTLVVPDVKQLILSPQAKSRTIAIELIGGGGLKEALGGGG